MEYTMAWLGIMIVLIVIELVTVGLTTIWFAAGALAALLVAYAGGGLVWQILIFLVVSLVLLIFTRPFALRFINTERVRTNSEALIGKVVRITQDVDNIAATGTAMVDGLEWTARAVSDETHLAAGMLAKVVQIQGVKLIVEPYEEDITA